MLYTARLLYCARMKAWRIIALGLALGLVTFGAFVLADSLTPESQLYQAIQTMGFFGIVALGIATGLNPVVPIPAATFAPVLLESGVSVYAVIAGFVIGTTIADSIGYALGWFGRMYTSTEYPQVTRRVNDFLTNHTQWVVPAACVYFAFAPLPNELILIPLALAGYPYTKLILPVLLGNTIHHTLLVLGYGRLFNYFF